MRLLAGDVGGTKTRLALIEVVGNRVAATTETSYRSGELESLNEAIERFRSDHPLPYSGACFGVPGPVRNGRCVTTNLPWGLDTGSLAEATGVADTMLINDLEATAWGIAALGPEHFHVLNPGKPGASGNASVIAAGTGLGEAGLFWDGDRHVPFASEGGHTDFSPGNELEIALLHFLSRNYQHVSWERVVSGPGLVRIFDFLCDHRGTSPSADLLEEFGNGDPAAAIAEAALSERDALCDMALDLFVHLYGVEAGNHALKIMATGGVYVGGGIAPKILPKLRKGRFMEAFTSKGRMAPLLAEIPVRVILDDRAALYGPAVYLTSRRSVC